MAPGGNDKTTMPHGHVHIVVVEAYLGHLEHCEDGPAPLTPALGLPVEALAEALDARITVLDWSQWQAYEADPSALQRWMPYPATKSLDVPPPRGATAWPDASRVTARPIPARDSDTGRPFTEGLSPRSYGLLAESDPLFLASYVLDQFLQELHARDPFALVIVPMFGGLGYVAQMARATGAGLADVAFAALATGTSFERQQANAEGLWTRPAITRRQMEDLSLRLADLALCYGPHGRALAEAAGCADVVQAPRHLPAPLVQRLHEASKARDVPSAIQFAIEEPLQAASGCLVALDAARLLHGEGRTLARPIACSGTDMGFAPHLTRSFRQYWSSRGWAKALVEEGVWQWADGPLAEPATRTDPAAYQLRLFPSLFEHLPDVWHTLAAGQAVLLSPRAAEGLVGAAELPSALLLATEPTPETLAQRLVQLEALGSAGIEKLRTDLCDRVASAYEEEALKARQAPLVAALVRLLDSPNARAPLCLGHAARRLLDGRPGAAVMVPLAVIAPVHTPTLSVAIPCYEMGRLITETVESIWAAERLPDEVLLVDDGSRDEETAHAIAHLGEAAQERGLPLTLIRQGNRGLAAARNTALAAARSSHISFIDGDDLIHPAFYRLALDCSARNPSLGGVAAWAETFGEGVTPGFWNAPQPELPLLLAENTVIVPCLSPVALLRELGGYDTRQRYNYEDWELAIRIIAAGYPIVTIPRYLMRYRVRGDSLLRTMSDVQNQIMREEMFTNHRNTIEKFGPELAAQIEHRLMRQLERQARQIGGANSSGTRAAVRPSARAMLARGLVRVGTRLCSGLEARVRGR